MGPHDKDRSSLGYAGAIALSALGHAAFLYLALFALPRWFTPEETPPPAYTVKIVDSLPAGDLGTHLPQLSRHHHIDNPESPDENPPEPPEEKPPPQSKAPKIDAPNNDPNAIALNNATVTPEPTPEPTATPTPTPEPTAAETPVPAAKPTQAPTPEPTQEPTARPTHKPRPRPTARPTPRPQPRERTKNHGKHHRGASPKPTPNVMFAHARAIPRAGRTPSIKEQLRRVREQLMKEHLQQLAKIAKSRPEPGDDDTGDDEEGDGKQAPAAAGGDRSTGGGPVAAAEASNGHGYGVGAGTGSAGILQDPEFLLYYQKVQERIKDAWSFASGNRELTTTVTFGIGPDGKLTGIEVARSSNNNSFDESVKRAIRRAAPFPPPPAKYRDQFGQGVQAVFRLGDLRS